MPATKDKVTGKWESFFRYTDITGKIVPKHKRGFSTKKEALTWEREFLLQKSSDLNMSFKSLLELYREDFILRAKTSSYSTLKYSLKKYEYFNNYKVVDITPKVIRAWQSKLLKENYSNNYLKGLQKRLQGIFTYAQNVHGLKENPIKKTGLVKSYELQKEKEFWTRDEFNLFLTGIEENNIFYISLFNLLFYSGARIGEVLALTVKDIDFSKNQIKINKTFARIDKKDVVTIPKTATSIRVVDLHEEVMLLLKKQINTLYEPDKDTRIYPVMREAVRKRMMDFIKISGVKKIRLHDIRHSHVALLINIGVNIFEISRRIGHADASITSRVYAHIYETSGRKIADLLSATKMQP